MSDLDDGPPGWPPGAFTRRPTIYHDTDGTPFGTGPELVAEVKRLREENVKLKAVVITMPLVADERDFAKFVTKTGSREIGPEQP